MSDAEYVVDPKLQVHIGKGYALKEISDEVKETIGDVVDALLAKFPQHQEIIEHQLEQLSDCMRADREYKLAAARRKLNGQSDQQDGV
jgi:prefoldin subunit 5